MKFKPELYWLLHHGILLEWTTEPVSNRQHYVRNNKPKDEIAIRLKWMCKVKRPDLLPPEMLQAYADWQKADADWRKAYADWQKAYADWQKAYADWQKADADWQKAGADWRKAYADWQKAAEKHWPEIVARHKVECPGCPFDYERKTLVFPESK